MTIKEILEKQEKELDIKLHGNRLFIIDYNSSNVDVHDLVKSHISACNQELIKAIVDEIDNTTLCSYPKSSSQKEHNYNMSIIDEAVREAKFKIKSLLQQSLK